MAVASNSVAAAKGIKSGDVITAINHNPVTSRNEFLDALKDTSLSRGILLNFTRESKERFEVLKK